MTFWSGSGSADQYLCLIDLTPFSSDFKYAKKIIFSDNLPAGTYLSSVFIRKGKEPDMDPEPDTDPYLRLMDPDPRRPKTCGSPKLDKSIHGEFPQI